MKGATMEEAQRITNDAQEIAPSRKEIGIRLLYTLLYFVILEVLKGIIQVTVLFQFVYLLITQKYSNPVRHFTNRVTRYAYRVMRYMTLNENKRPFPFSDFPADIEPPESERVSFE
jgi:hypothetical protein